MEKKFEGVAANENNPKWEQMIKRKKVFNKKSGDIRTDFERDYTRVLYSTAYRRLKHKSQIYFSPASDHICTRIEHVNYVESISYTIANTLGLNTELTKAIAISHDLGHSPFGHPGEKILNDIMQKELGESFWHEKNGLNAVDNVILLENHDGNKANLNLTYAVRDGIISHCGEVNDKILFPREEAIDLDMYTKPNEYMPYTWEGCVVKLADRISYMGRDLEDSLFLKVLNEKQVEKLTSVLNIGKNMNNSNIISTLIYDLCANSSVEKGLGFSNEKIKLLDNLNEFYIKNIYTSEKLESAKRYFKLVLEEIFTTLYRLYDGENTIEKLKEKKAIYPKLMDGFIIWLTMYIKEIENGVNVKLYSLKEKKDYARAIIHYISGMTDKYAIDMYNEIISF
jgi:dGTPase